MVPEFGQVLAEVIVKSPGFAPLSAMLLIFNATVVLVSVRVEDLAALVDPTATERLVRGLKSWCEEDKVPVISTLRGQLQR